MSFFITQINELHHIRIVLFDDIIFLYNTWFEYIVYFLGFPKLLRSIISQKEPWSEI
jgi:hypothetical protein